MPRRVDANQSTIVAELRELGFRVAVTSNMGKGFPDIVVGDPRTDAVFLCEVKNPEYKWDLTPDEEKFHELWQGLIHIIESTEDALRLMGY